MIHKGSFLLIITLCFGVAACATTKITSEMVQKNLYVVIPEGDGKFPVVIYYQGTGAHNRRAEKWAEWFKTMGIASAIVDNARIRNRTENPDGSMYTEDAAIAWDLLKDNPKIDTNRFALMGFSRGGQQALEAGPLFKGKRTPPSLVFALYPGGWGIDRCVNTHKKPTEVHIFYGDLDDAGRYDGYNSACRSLAKWSKNVKFHELKGATHCYDDIYSYTFE
jgi:dienelactone hydrolase